ncbi:hypothetical protein OCJ35_21865 [Pluralibacter gergoviae]|uniref:hypothetical protein n=1 Tax=Pluralibacter gergoviae TaxID=61647 RepID=UPI001FF1C70C|nr:hypothetical protein [Pluralibacter gergoviae]MCK1068661.1 hypothetical protein [Pluralibacter gergoviae]MCV7760734.1 hypothetical protein [Pluralibacter gergoviae]HDS1115188.1 hypothetical protein [Pluralibacter gergoviae]HDS1238137.1 hypothetical protein [Pluralibacter gergoviae]HDS1239478.1 hypothetical protein [Pluralibacter gergoviae]
MLDRVTLELTMLEIARQNGQRVDNHTRYTIRTGLIQALQAKELHRRRMNTPAYQWKKPAAPRR